MSRITKVYKQILIKNIKLGCLFSCLEDITYKMTRYQQIILILTFTNKRIRMNTKKKRWFIYKELEVIPIYSSKVIYKHLEEEKFAHRRLIKISSGYL